MTGSWDIAAGRRRDWQRPVAPTGAIRKSAYGPNRRMSQQLTECLGRDLNIFRGSNF
jgi:hypothetical protein